jgi:hypothetical protein
MNAVGGKLYQRWPNLNMVQVNTDGRMAEGQARQATILFFESGQALRPSLQRRIGEFARGWIIEKISWPTEKTS